jgi:hypothetical protein
MATATARKPKTERLQEYADNRGVSLNVDAEHGIVKGVKILGFQSKNNRVYSKEAVAQAIGLYEGAKVNIDHAKGSNEVRGYRDRFGAVKNVREASGGLFADFHYNPKHPSADQFIWDATNASANVGFSHNVEGRTRYENGKTIVEAITKVHSVDLVADPATTNGIFEDTQEPAMDFKELTLEQIKTHRPDLTSAILTEQKNSDAEKARDAEVKTLREELDKFKAKEAVDAKRSKIDALIVESKLPKEAATEIFVEQLMAADESQQKLLIEDRKALVEAKSTGGTKPQSKGPEQITEGEIKAGSLSKPY